MNRTRSPYLIDTLQKITRLINLIISCCYTENLCLSLSLEPGVSVGITRINRVTWDSNLVTWDSNLVTWRSIGIRWLCIEVR
jgi:hypothetical protein